MCGILAAFGLVGSVETNRRKVLKASQLLRHRGPEASGVYSNADGSVVMSHERLCIIDPTDAGKQPMKIERPEGAIIWMINSEIYNHEKIRETLIHDVDLSWTTCDSAVVGYLYQKFGATAKIFQALDGIFCGVIYDESSKQYFAFRDPIGICPMYWGKGADGSVWFASEMKALQDTCEELDIFPPGHMYSSVTQKIDRFFEPSWITSDSIPSNPVDYAKIKELVIKAVVKRLMTDVPLAIFLSGGLDSSLVASIASKHIHESNNTYNKNEKLHTFSIGIKGAPDLLAARQVAEYLNTVHHEYNFTVEEGIDALRDLIYYIESYHQARAAVPNYLLARRVKAKGFKVILSGEGADECLGGYLYFHKAPSPEEFHRETVRKVERLHQWDVLRANKSCFAWGLEVRVPFLDLNFLDCVMNVDPKEKICDMSYKPDGVHPKMEKYILRKAFDDKENPYLPDSVLYRQKEQFSDGVGYDWVDGLQKYAEQVVSDEEWGKRFSIFPEDTPNTKEYFMLQSIFKEQFQNKCSIKTIPKGGSIACSTPEAIGWDPAWKDMHEISGRAIDVHSAAADFTVKKEDKISNGY